VFPTLFILFYLAHLAADYPLQTDHQAACKAERSAAGWRANVAHAGTHLLTSAAVLAIGVTALDLTIGWTEAAVGIAWIGITHSLIDRRRGVQWWMRNTRQPQFAQHGGAAHVDQTAHVIALAVAALGIAAT
jgi:hypothetical protein